MAPGVGPAGRPADALARSTRQKSPALPGGPAPVLPSAPPPLRAPYPRLVRSPRPPSGGAVALGTGDPAAAPFWVQFPAGTGTPGVARGRRRCGPRRGKGAFGGRATRARAGCLGGIGQRGSGLGDAGVSGSGAQDLERGWAAPGAESRMRGQRLGRRVRSGVRASLGAGSGVGSGRPWARGLGCGVSVWGSGSGAGLETVAGRWVRRGHSLLQGWGGPVGFPRAPRTLCPPWGASRGGLGAWRLRGPRWPMSLLCSRTWAPARPSRCRGCWGGGQASAAPDPRGTGAQALRERQEPKPSPLLSVGYFQSLNIISGNLC